jgi:hypothetical protein
MSNACTRLESGPALACQKSSRITRQTPIA